MTEGEEWNDKNERGQQERDGTTSCPLSRNSFSVIPAEAGIQDEEIKIQIDSRLRGNDRLFEVFVRS